MKPLPEDDRPIRRPTRAIAWLAVAALLAALAAPAPPAGAEEPPKGLAKSPNDPAGTPLDGRSPGSLPTISVDEIQRGQRGYGLSVFSGTEPERFEVEVIGVMRNLSPNVSYILARLTGHGLEQSGVAGGMSGSPVFLDGRLAGAVAFSWPFSNDAIAGITPIDGMRQLSTLQGMDPISPPPPPVPMSELLGGRVPEDLLERELSRLKPVLAGGVAPAIQWTTTGFGEGSMGILRRALGSVTPAGQALPGGPADLAPGRSVAAVLVDGDFQLAATGTVTDQYGDQVLAFGHAFLGLGPIRVPMATSEVVTVLSSQYNSFKISNIGEVVGAFEQDRLLGIQGRIGAVAPMIPVSLRVTGAGKGEPQTFQVRVAEVPFYTPMLIGSTLVAALESASYTSGAQGIDLDARFRLKGHGDLVIRQSFDGASAGAESASYLLGIASYLAQNSLEPVAFESVEIDVVQSPKPRAAALVGAHADRTVVRPGERVNLNLDLVPYRGERFRHTLAVDLPADLPAGRYYLFVGDGASADAARFAVEPADPVSLHQALEMLRSFHSRREVVVLGVYGGHGLSVGGEVMPRLPGSVRSLWGAAPSGSAVQLRTTIAQQLQEEMPVPVEGLVRIDLEVRRAPVLAQGAGGNGEGEDGTGSNGGPEGASSPSGEAGAETATRGSRGTPPPSGKESH